MKGILMLMMIVAVSGSAIASDISSEEIPKWLNGTLLMNTVGTERLDDRLYIDQYACAFDFSRDKISMSRIPTDATLLSEIDTGFPICLHSTPDSYESREFPNGSHPAKWRRFTLDKMVLSKDIVGIAEMEDSFDIDWIHAPMTILGIDGVTAVSYTHLNRPNRCIKRGWIINSNCMEIL